MIEETEAPFNTLTNAAAPDPPVPVLSNTATSPTLYPVPGVTILIESIPASTEEGVLEILKNPVSIGLTADVESALLYLLIPCRSSGSTNLVTLNPVSTLPA